MTDASSPARFVIIGAGPAGMRAAEVLRAGAPQSDITLIGDEPHLPYQRPPLSKQFLTGEMEEAQLWLKPASFYAEQRIVLRLGAAATRIDRGAKEVELAGGERLRYDKLLLAMGCRCRMLPAAFAFAPVSYLRGLDDAARLKPALARGGDIVLVGGGFIGLELAASATQRGGQVVVIEAASRLLSRSMPPVIGDYVRRLHEGHGVRFEFEARLESVEAGLANRCAVRTERREYDADLVIAGIGAEPNTDLAASAGLALEDGIRTDACGRTSDPDIFAAGDVTRHDNPLLGRAIRVESWQVALNQAAAVARAMLGAGEPYAELPWLWTDQYDCNIQTLGLFDPGQELLLRGDPAASSFTVLGLDASGRIAAAATVNNGRDMAVLRRLAALPSALPREALADPGRKLADLLKAARASA